VISEVAFGVTENALDNAYEMHLEGDYGRSVLDGSLWAAGTSAFSHKC
jgi:hypothetical protein